MSDQYQPQTPQEPTPPQEPQSPPVQPQAYQQPQYQQYSQAYQDPNITADDKTWGGLSYIPIVALLVLFIKDKAERWFIKKQAVQSIALSVAVFIISFLFGWIPLIGWLFDFLLWIAFGIYMLMNLIKAINGNDVTIPVITDFVRKQGWIR